MRIVSPFLAGGLCAAMLAASPAMAKDPAVTIRELIHKAYLAFEKRDVATAQSIYVTGERLIVYDMFPSAATNGTGYNQLGAGQVAASDVKAFEGREVGFDPLYKKVEQQVASTTGPINFKLYDLDVTVDHNHAYSRYISEINGTLTSGKPFSFITRVTDVWERINGKWLIVLEHSSAPPR
jgi:ketosteroid isomerase-like protein